MKPGRPLEVEELSISVSNTNTGSRPLFRSLDFSVERGEVLAIIGQSGSGKTTLARAIVGLLPSQVTNVHGRIAVNGRLIHTLNPRELRSMRRDEVNLIFQDPGAALNPTMKIGRQLFPSSERGSARKATDRLGAAVDMLRRLQLDDPRTCLEAYPFELSGGMKQRILIASSLLAEPSLIIADEPTSALDPVLRKHVLEIFLKLTRESGTAVVLITHDLPLVGGYADRVLTLRDGTMTESSSPRDFLPHPHEALTSSLRMPSVTGGEGPPASLEQVPVLRVSGLNVDYSTRGKWAWQSPPRRRIIDDAHIEVWRGEIVGLLGASGAGKSTLGRSVLGLAESSSGTISINGELMSPRRLTRRANSAGNVVQVIYQNPFSSLSPKMTVRSIVLEALRAAPWLNRQEREALFCRVMSDVGLELEFAKRRPHQLSGGQRQRVAIARALIGKPTLVVADEPVSSLDTVACNQVLELISRLRGLYGFACLFISHDLGVLRVIADRIAVMEEGRIVETGTAQQILESPAHPSTARFVAAAGLAPATAP